VKSTIRYLAMGRMLNHEADKQNPAEAGFLHVLLKAD